MEILDDYFAGTMPASEKRKMFEALRTDNAARAEFIRIQNAKALTGLYPCNGDAAYAARMRQDLMRQFGAKRTRRIITEVMKYAAIIVLIAVNAWLLYNRNSEDKIVLQNIIEAPEGQHVHITFADGTEAWLSPRTVVKSPERFGKKERLIELDGEGFFSVAKDQRRPFIVRTGQYDVKALGTRFNVFAYSASPRFETNLVEGKVAVVAHDNPDSPIILSPGHSVIFKNDIMRLTSTPFDNEDYLKKGIFTFRNKPLVDILDYLSLWYNINFEIETSLPLDRLYSGKVRQSDDVKVILKALQDIHPFNFNEISEKSIRIY